MSDDTGFDEWVQEALTWMNEREAAKADTEANLEQVKADTGRQVWLKVSPELLTQVLGLDMLDAQLLFVSYSGDMQSVSMAVRVPNAPDGAVGMNPTFGYDEPGGMYLVNPGWIFDDVKGDG